MIAFVVILVVVLGVCALAAFRPELAFVTSLLLFGVEGSVKVLLTEDGNPVPFSARATGAALLDVAFAVSVFGLLLHRRGVARDLWRQLGSAGQLALTALAAWLALSIAQIAQGDSVVAGLDGFRLTQFYVLAAVGGALLIAYRRSAAVEVVLAGLAVIAAYGAVRAIAGPSESERAYALAREGVTEFQQGEIFRTVGSFSGAVGLVSFLVPAAVFAFAVTFLAGRYRSLGVLVLSCALVAIVGTYVRSGVVALAIGLIVAVALALPGAVFSGRRKAVIGAVALAAIAVAGLATAIAAEEAPETRGRAGGLIRPASDESLALRRQVWRRALVDIRAEPLGTGLGTVGHASGRGDDETTTTDNSYLKIAREQGVAGVLLFALGVFGLCVVVARALLRAPPGPRTLATAALSAFASFLALAFVGEYVEQPGKVVAWTLLGVGVASVFGRSERS